MLKKTLRNIHPGEILREEVININRLTVTEAARLLGITRVNLSNILNEKSDISPEMCHRISAVFGGSPEIWADLQMKYNLKKSEQRIRHLKLTRYHPVST